MQWGRKWCLSAVCATAGAGPRPRCGCSHWSRSCCGYDRTEEDGSSIRASAPPQPYRWWGPASSVGDASPGGLVLCVWSGRGSTAQAADIHVGTPNRGSTNFIRTNQTTTNAIAAITADMGALILPRTSFAPSGPRTGGLSGSVSPAPHCCRTRSWAGRRQTGPSCRPAKGRRFPCYRMLGRPGWPVDLIDWRPAVRTWHHTNDIRTRRAASLVPFAVLNTSEPLLSPEAASLGPRHAYGRGGRQVCCSRSQRRGGVDPRTEEGAGLRSRNVAS
jgi:hypothetical protein